jgi:hypothetical protein
MFLQGVKKATPKIPLLNWTNVLPKKVKGMHFGSGQNKELQLGILGKVVT